MDGEEGTVNQTNVKIVLISDTHSRHEKLGTLPDGDILIHAGNFTACLYTICIDQPSR